MRHLLLACLLAALAVTTSGCATVIFGLIGVAGCGGDTNCMGNAVSGGLALDGAILQGAVDGSQRAANDAPEGYVCSSPDSADTFAAPSLRDAWHDCMTYGRRPGTDGECECGPASSVPAPAPWTAGGQRYAPPPLGYALREGHPPHDEPESAPEERGPTEDEVREALSFAAVRARECGASRYGTAGVDIVFERAGYVRAVVVHAVGLPPKLRACVADAVSEARVPPFERATIHVRYPIRL